jgi:hypothetical protein
MALSPLLRGTMPLSPLLAEEGHGVVNSAVVSDVVVTQARCRPLRAHLPAHLAAAS